MICIFSKYYEPTTDYVISFLLKNNMKFVRFNEEEGMEDIFSGLCSDKIELKLNNIILSNKDHYWIYQYNLLDACKTPIEDREIIILRDYLLNKISGNDNALGSSLADIYHNKLLDLELAKECGMDIPASYIISSLDDCYNLNLKDNTWIVKPMSDYFAIRNGDNVSIIDMYKVKLDDVAHFSEAFFPTLFQQFIEKTFEIRIVVIKENIYAIAYFASGQNAISFKYSNDEEMQRMVPFNLPDYLVKSILNYMNARNLNFASFDFIYSQNTDKFYFIECNPVGQMDWVSKAGNYYIEKEIAKILQDEK